MRFRFRFVQYLLGRLLIVISSGHTLAFIDYRRLMGDRVLIGSEASQDSGKPGSIDLRPRAALD